MSGSREDELIVVGSIAKTHGVKGEVTIQIDSDNPDRFEPPARFHTAHPRFPLLVLRSSRPGPNGLIAEFAGITSIELAEELRGHELMIRQRDRRPLTHGEFWPDDLVGLTARIGAVDVGTVTAVTLGSQTRITIRAEDGRSIEVPFVDQIVSEINLKLGWVSLDPPEGLFSEE